MKQNKLSIRLSFLFTLNIFLCFAQDSTTYQVPDYLIEPQREISTFSNFSDGMARFNREFNQYGYINTKGEIAIPAKFYDAGDFHNDRAWVAIYDSITHKPLYGFINKKGNLIIDYQYLNVGDFSSGRAPVNLNGQWVYIDKEGSLIFKPLQNVKRSFYDGLLLQRKDGKYGYVDVHGKTVIPYKYETSRDFSDGLAVVETESLLQHDSNGGKNKLFANTNTYHYLVIDTLGRKVFDFPKNVTRVEDFSDGLACFYEDKKGHQGRWGIIDKKGKVVIPARFKNKPFDFCDGVGFVQVDGRRTDNKDGKILTYDRDGNILAEIPLTKAERTIFTSNARYQGGLLAVQISGQTQNKNTWTYIDKYGNSLFTPQFSHALNFYEGFAIIVIAKNGKLGFLKNPLNQE